MTLAVDIGATKTQLARLRDDGTLDKSERIPTVANPDRFLEDLRALMRDFLGTRLDRIEAIGIGAPGPLDPENGVFGRLPNLPDWDGFALAKALRAHHAVPVRVQNDANVAALGEAVYGGGRGFHSVYYITISTGIGGGYVLDRRIVSGSRDLAGEIWTLPILNLNQPDILLNSSSGPGIVRTAQRLLDQGQPSALAGLADFDTKEVFQMAEQGDDLCRRVTGNASHNMALAVIAILVVVDPDIVLIGGGMAGDERRMIDPIRRQVAELAHLEKHRRTPVRQAELWDEAVLYGALSLAEA